MVTDDVTIMHNAIGGRGMALIVCPSGPLGGRGKLTCLDAGLTPRFAAGLSGHTWHCPLCDVHLTSLGLCPTCGVRYELPETENIYR